MDNIRSETFLGNKKVIVGNKYSDLVLETLGKVYIKYGNNTKLLNDVFKLLDKAVQSDTDVQSKVIIVANVTELNTLKYPGEGYLIYNTGNDTLYISYNKEYIPLIEGNSTGDYVKKTGDSMTGALEIITDAAPLIVKSSKLVENLNTQYLNGLESQEYAVKRRSERIDGTWTFNGANTANNSWAFKRNLYVGGDIVSYLGFAPGFAGYGWKLDASTNTLTIDNIIVRKTMQVFELVVNKISATNGSLWISNSGKIEVVYKLNLDRGFSVTLPKSDIGSDVKTYMDYTSFTSENIENSEVKVSGDIYFTSNDGTNVPFNKDISKLELKVGATPEQDSREYLYLYRDYFKGDFYIFQLDKEGNKFPPFKPNDILRCQKFVNNNIKYYDAIVTNYVNAEDGNYYIIRLADSVYDLYSKYTVREDGIPVPTPNTFNPMANPDRPENVEDDGVNVGSLAIPEIGDGMVQMGNTCMINRQNAMYLTSSDEDSPYMDVLSGLDRPDFSVVKSFIKTIDGEEVIESKTPLKCKLGNLKGIYDPILKKQPFGYGFYSDNVWLKGEFYLQNGQTVVDFSEEQILLKFKTAGLLIHEIPNTDKTEIILTADQIKFNTIKNSTAVTLITEDENGQAILDVQGTIQSHGLYINNGQKTTDSFIYDEASGAYKDTSGRYVDKFGYIINAYINKTGNLYAKDAYLTNCFVQGTIEANSGYVGGFKISENRLISTDDTTKEEMLLSTHLIKFTNQYTGVYLGANTIPGSVGDALYSPMRIEVKRKRSDMTASSNIGIYLDVSGEKSYSDVLHSGNNALCIPRGRIMGFRLRQRITFTSQLLSNMDSIILSRASNDVTYTLPSNCEDGQMFIIKKHGSGRVYVRTETNADDISATFDRRYREVDLDKGQCTMFTYDAPNKTWWTVDWWDEWN